MDRRDIRWVIGFLLAGAAGLGLFVGLYDRTFPTAALDFKLSREQASAAAEGFLASEGIATKGFERAMVFEGDEDAQMFLEKRLGLQEANRLARTEVSVWFWSVRWFRPEQKEEFRVELDPGGRAVGFRRLLLDTDPGGNLAQEEALPKVGAFLRARGFDLSGYDLIEKSSEKRERRTDHTFTYQKKGFRIFDLQSDSLKVGEPGTYRLRVTIQGDRVGGFREFLKVPEAFIRNYQEVRARANLLAQVAGVLWVALGLAMIVFLIRKTREGGVSHETALYLGAAVAVAWLTAEFNSLPLTKFGYDTQVSYSSFILNALVTSLLGGVFYGLIVCLSGMSGGACFSEAFGSGRGSPLGRPSWQGILSAQTARAALIGYGLACLHLGYVTVFYLAGIRYLGVWAPAETTYSNAFSTSIPWIYALQIGLAAATLEEFFFRLFAVSYLKRLLGRTWMAVLIPAVIWAFLHSTYAVEPIYIRGVELTVVGVMFGLVFLRFGIWATVIAHYAYDAALVALPMIKSSSLYFRASGLVVVGIVLLPAAAAALSGLVKKRTAERPTPPPPLPEGEGGAEARQTVSPPQEEIRARTSPLPVGEGQGVRSRTPDDYPLDRRTRTVAILAGLAGLALLLWARPGRLGERTMRVGVSRAAAVRAAEGFVERAGVPLSGYRRTAWFQDDLGADGYTFLIRRVGVARAESLAAEQTRPWVWWVRWYRPLEKEEVRVAVDARDGRVAGWSHALPEDRKGADLTPEGARRAAEAFLLTHFSRDVTDTTRYVLKESSSERREGRRDHDFVWERRDVTVGEGRFRATVTVQGDRVDGVALTFKTPEAFLRELRRETVVDVAARLGATLLVLLTVVWGTILFIRAFRDRALSWRIPNRLGLLSLLAFLIAYLNGLSTFFAGYGTATALSTYTGGRVLSSLLGVGFQAAAVAVALALVEAMWRRAYPEEAGPEGWCSTLGGCASLRVCGEALVLAGAFLLWRWGISSATAWARQRLFPQYSVASGFAPVPELSAYLPALRLQGAVGATMGMLALLGVFLVWRHYVRRTWVILAVAVAFLLLSGAVSEAKTFGHFAGVGALDLLSAGATLWFVFRVVRFRLLTYFFAAWIGAFVSTGVRLIEASDLAFYEVNGAAMILIGLLPLWYVAKSFFTAEGAEGAEGKRKHGEYGE